MLQSFGGDGEEEGDDDEGEVEGTAAGGVCGEVEGDLKRQLSGWELRMVVCGQSHEVSG